MSEIIKIEPWPDQTTRDSRLQVTATRRRISSKNGRHVDWVWLLLGREAEIPGSDWQMEEVGPEEF